MNVCVCWNGRGKGPMSLAQLMVPGIRDSSRKDWVMPEGHRKLPEGFPMEHSGDNFIFSALLRYY